MSAPDLTGLCAIGAGATDPGGCATAIIDWATPRGFALSIFWEGRLLAGDAALAHVVYQAEGLEVRSDGTSDSVAQPVGVMLSLVIARSAADGERRRLVHDLRGALAILSGQCEILESGLLGAPTPEQARSLKAMSRQIERLRDLIERVRSQGR